MRVLLHLLLCFCRWKLPEGRYELVDERVPSYFNFNFAKSSRLTLAQLGTSQEDTLWLLYSLGEAHVHVSRCDAPRKVRNAA